MPSGRFGRPFWPPALFHGSLGLGWLCRVRLFDTTGWQADDLRQLLVSVIAHRVKSIFVIADIFHITVTQGIALLVAQQPAAEFVMKMSQGMSAVCDFYNYASVIFLRCLL